MTTVTILPIAVPITPSAVTITKTVTRDCMPEIMVSAKEKLHQASLNMGPTVDGAWHRASALLPVSTNTFNICMLCVLVVCLAGAITRLRIYSLMNKDALNGSFQTANGTWDDSESSDGNSEESSNAMGKAIGPGGHMSTFIHPAPALWRSSESANTSRTNDGTSTSPFHSRALSPYQLRSLDSISQEAYDGDDDNDSEGLTKKARLRIKLPGKIHHHHQSFQKRAPNSRTYMASPAPFKSIGPMKASLAQPETQHDIHPQRDRETPDWFAQSLHSIWPKGSWREKRTWVK